MARQKENNYFEMFVEGVNFSCEAASMLHANLANYRPDELPKHLDAMHQIEHNADIAKHSLMGRLLKEFITPIDREDIIDLANAIDNVTDAIEDVLVRMYMFNVAKLRQDAEPFGKIIMDCCNELKVLMQEFENFRKSKTIKDKIIAINRLEEDGDKLYIQAVHDLHNTSQDNGERMVWTALFELLEKCCDQCEDVADVVERVILKNS